MKKRDDDRIKILQVIGDTRVGGVASCLLNYMRFCDLSRYRFDFVTYAPFAFDEKVHMIDEESRIYYIPPIGKKPLRAMMRLGKIYDKDDYAAVHSHMTILSAVVLPPALSAGIGTRICHAHSTFNRSSDRFLIKKLMRPFADSAATNLMACSSAAAQCTFGKYANTAEILPNAIDTDKFSCTKEQHEEAKRLCGLTKTTALFTGRFCRQKNLSLLINAFAKANRDDMQLVLIGDGEMRDKLISLCDSLNLNSKVRFVAPCDTKIWYKAADIFCLPSLYEGISLSAMEAQAAGLPCLLSEAIPAETDVTGNCKFINADMDAWAKALGGNFNRLWNAQEKVAEAGYDIKREAHRLTDFYDRIIGGAH
ncbi:MAG: glycosyltransferase [Clostridia bacterium]|nr:glycosyltransferase [Clostridia bacterium]